MRFLVQKGGPIFGPRKQRCADLCEGSPIVGGDDPSRPRRQVPLRRLASQSEAGQQISPSGSAAGAVHVDSLEPTGTSPVPPTPVGATGDHETNDSAPRPSRREAEPQRRLTGWSAALSRLANMRQNKCRNTHQKVRHHAPRKCGKLGAIVCRRSQPGPRSGVNGPHPPRPAGGVAPEGCPLGGAWRSQAPPVNGPKSVVQTRSWPRGVDSAGRRRSRRPALTGPGPVPRPATSGSRSMHRLIHR